MNRRDFSIAAIATSAAAMSGCQGDDAHRLIGTKLPAIKGVYTDGSGFDLAAIKKPAVIRFWGMWCGPCMLDMPNWLSAVRQLRVGEKAVPNLNIFTIHVGLPPSNGPSLRQWVSEQSADVATPVVDDATNAIMKAVGIMGTPSTIYVEPDGRIAEHSWQFKNERGVATFLKKVAFLHSKSAR